VRGQIITPVQRDQADRFALTQSCVQKLQACRALACAWTAGHKMDAIRDEPAKLLIKWSDTAMNHKCVVFRSAQFEPVQQELKSSV
jgi:hypothetical protein